MNAKFWSSLEALVAGCALVIDRPKGSTHPRYPAAVYPVDYGYLKGTTGGDGQGIDIWRGSLANSALDAIMCTINSEKRDAELKLLLGCSDDEKKQIVDF